MGLYHNRPTVADIRALKGQRKLTMLYVDTPQEAAAAATAGIDMQLGGDCVYCASSFATLKALADDRIDHQPCGVDPL